MKKVLILIILISLISPVVLAGEIHRLDLNKNPVEVREIREGDLVEISIGNKTQKIILKKVLFPKNIINLALFIEGSDTPSYISMSYNQQMRLDFYNDKVDDMILVLESLSPEQARIIFRSMDEKGNPVITNQEIGGLSKITGEEVKGNNAPNLKTGIIIIASIIIVGLIISFIFLKK
ncbi:hypothetical protein HY500_02520 [Candidatus Woesearchaeota archaeon]|nr:hypothetical protein [Candidatus Woesearchaeota archaeon]